MSKSPDAFRSIGEVADLVGVAPHVLRYWETQFSQLSPVKRSDGRRYYRPDDVCLVAGLCQIMREDGMSIRGATRMIQSDRGASLRRLGAARLGEASRDAPSPTPEPPPAVAAPVNPLPTAADAEPPQDWLARLCTTSHALRQLENGHTALPKGADKLRAQLNSAL